MGRFCAFFECKATTVLHVRDRIVPQRQLSAVDGAAEAFGLLGVSRRRDAAGGPGGGGGGGGGLGLVSMAAAEPTHRRCLQTFYRQFLFPEFANVVRSAFCQVSPLLRPR